MIPSDNLMLTPTNQQQFNIYRSASNLDSKWVYLADEYKHDNQVDMRCHYDTSRTDKPRLAHEIYGHWMAILSLRNDQISGHYPTHTLPTLNRNDLLVAAYSGSQLIYRK